MGKKMNFKSKASYAKWIAYDKMHITPGKSKNPVKVKIKGKTHKVKHSNTDHMKKNVKVNPPAEPISGVPSETLQSNRKAPNVQVWKPFGI